jgi:KDO2-lipid IV(A) lauroyltransferase
VSATPTNVEPIPDKPHAPATGLSRRLLGPLHVTGVFWYWAHRLVTFGPEWGMRLACFLFSWFFWCVLWRIRAAVASNLEAVLGPCGFVERQRRIWRTFHDFAWCMTERYEQFHRGRAFRVDYEGEETWRALHERSCGFVFFTAHLGNWEMGPLVDRVPAGRRMHVVREPEMSRAAQRYVERLFANHPRKSYVLHYAGSDLQLGARLLLALRKGDIVTLPGDRPRAGMGSLRSTLFGRPMDLPPGPALLARAAGAMLVPVFVFREGRRHYRVVALPPFPVDTTDDKARDVQAAVDCMAAAVEWAIRRRPHHWHCWARLWPRGATSAAADAAARPTP